MYEPVHCEFNPNPKFIPRDYQEPIIQYILEDGKVKILDMQPGDGKTLCTLISMVNIGDRTAIVLPPKYIDQWVGQVTDPDNYLDLDPGDDILVIKGTRPLINLIALAKSGELTAKIIIMSSKSLYTYFKQYELYNGDMFLYHDIAPYDLWKTLEVGLRVVDEIHEDFHLNFKIDLYTHVPKSIGLSATLEPDDSFLDRMYQLAFPKYLRRNKGKFDKHVLVKSLFYGLGDNTGKDMIKYTNKVFRAYSHVRFEQTLMKNKKKLPKFLQLIKSVVDREYIANFEPGRKTIVYAQTVDMCEVIVEYLKHEYPDKSVTKYTQEDDYSELAINDIIVSTLKSAGTAIDIKGLISTICTVAISSKQANIQLFGRLRPDKKLDFPPTLCHLVCKDIPKHINYIEKKKEYLPERSLNMIELETKIIL